MSLPHHGHEPIVAAESSAVREPFGVAQIVCLIAGILFVVLGAIGLARTGFEDMTGDETRIGALGSTGLLAVIHLAIGLAALVGATSRSGSRGACMFLGPLFVAAGIIALIEPIDALGFTTANGVVYLITGAIMILAAMLTPLVAVTDRRVTSL